MEGAQRTRSGTKITTTVGVDCFMKLALIEYSGRSGNPWVRRNTGGLVLYYELLIYKPYYLRLTFKANRNQQQCSNA